MLYASSCKFFFATVEDCDAFMEPSPCGDQNFRLLSTEYPMYLADRWDRWNLGRRLIAELDWSFLNSKEIKEVYQKIQDHRAGALLDIRVYVAPCKRQISTAVNICSDILCNSKLIDCYIRVDDRLPAGCCSKSATSDRLKSLLSELAQGNHSANESFDQKRFETIDRLWLEQRLYDIDDDIDRDPTTVKTQLSDRLRSVYDCTGLNKTLAAILLIGEPSLINVTMNTQPFPASPRVARPNEFFEIAYRYLVGAKGSHYVRKYLGSIDVSPKHKRAQAPTLPQSPPASQSSLKRGFETDLDMDSSMKRNNTHAEPESEEGF